MSTKAWQAQFTRDALLDKLAEAYSIPVGKRWDWDWRQEPLWANWACGQNILTDNPAGLARIWLNLDNVQPGVFPCGFMNNLRKVFNVDLLRQHPFPNRLFAGGICEDFVEHLTEPQLLFFLSEVRRTLMRGGRCFVSWPSWDKQFTQPAKALSQARLRTFLAKQYHQWGHVCLYSVEHLLRLAQTVGLSGAEVSDVKARELLVDGLAEILVRSLDTNSLVVLYA